MSNLSDFLPLLPESIIFRTLIADYLLDQGYLLCDLQFLDTEDAVRLYDEAWLFAHRKVNDRSQGVSLTRYATFGFSLN